MAFMLGSFTTGLASGAKSAMDLYSKYEDLKSKKDLSDSLTGAMKSGGTTTPPAGTAPGQATGFLGNAQSDSAASAPKSSVDLNADPRATRGSAALGAFGNAVSDSAMSAPRKSPYGNAKSDAAMSAPEPTSSQPAQEAVQTQPPLANPTGDVSMPVPQSATPTRAQATAPSPWMDWLTGRNPQNRAVHLTPSMGIATGPGPSSTPMSTSPGGRPVGASVSDWASNAPHYLPQQGQQPAAPQGQPAQPVGSRPPPLAGAPSPGSPSLSNQQSPMAQAIQTQYGSGGF